MNYDKEIRKKQSIERKRLFRLNYCKDLDKLDLFELNSYFIVENKLFKYIKNAYKDLNKFLEHTLECKKYYQEYNSVNLHHFQKMWLQEDLDDCDNKIKKLSHYLLNKDLSNKEETKKKVVKI